MSEKIINWTNDDVWTARDRHVIFRDGSRHLVKCGRWGAHGYVSGWAIGEQDGLDIFHARYILNMNEAVLEAES